MNNYNRIVVFIVALMVGVLSWWAGNQNLIKVDTDSFSEGLTLSTAYALVDGHQAYGLRHDTHYPPGPCYVLALAVKLFPSLRDHTLGLRQLPLIISAISYSIFTVALGSIASAMLGFLGAVFLLGALALQPGLLLWQGALHSHSYAASLALLSVAAIVFFPSSSWVLALMGFVAAWIAFDPLPVLVGIVMSVALLMRGASGRALPSVLKGGLGDAMYFVAGIGAAILVHFAQDVLFLRSYDNALRDLFGSAAARGGLGSAQFMTPLYNDQVGQQETADLSLRFQELFANFAAFLEPRYSNRLVIYGFAGLSLIATLAAFSRGSHKSQRVVILVIATLALIGGASVWALLMPQHVGIHVHFTPRTYLIAGFALILFPLLAFRMSNARHMQKRSVMSWLRLAILISPLVLLALLGLQLYLRFGRQHVETIMDYARAYSSTFDSHESDFRPPKFDAFRFQPAADAYWFSGGGAAPPFVYGYRFDRRVQVQSMRIRFCTRTAMDGNDRFVPTYYVIDGWNDGQKTRLAKYVAASSLPPELDQWKRPDFLVHDWTLKTPQGLDKLQLSVKQSGSGESADSGIYITEFTAKGHSDQSHSMHALELARFLAKPSSDQRLPRVWLNSSRRDDGVMRGWIESRDWVFERGFSVASPESLYFLLPESVRAVSFYAALGNDSTNPGEYEVVVAADDRKLIQSTQLGGVAGPRGQLLRAELSGQRSLRIDVLSSPSNPPGKPPSSMVFGDALVYTSETP